MNGTMTDTETDKICSILKEYNSKMHDLVDFLTENEGKWLSGLGSYSTRLAWALDTAEHLQKPLRAITERASVHIEQGYYDQLVRDELTLRLVEFRTHLHHLLATYHRISEQLEKSRNLDLVQKHRYSAGLSAMKGGPLRPAS